MSQMTTPKRPSLLDFHFLLTNIRCVGRFDSTETQVWRS